MTQDHLINLYITRFINRTDIWGKQWLDRRETPPQAKYAKQSADMDTKGGRYAFEPVTPDLVRRHFIGDLTCAWAAIDQDLKSKWLCFDSDTADGALDRLDAFLHRYGWKTIREGRRQGRDGHLWLLFNKPLPAEMLIVLSDAIMTLAGACGLERFPKYAEKYSQVRGPLGVNLKPEAHHARGLFDGAEPNLMAQLAWLAVQPVNSAEDALREAQRHRPKVKRETVRRRVRSVLNTRHDFQILDFVDAREVGREWVAQCPLCRNEGHDRHEDNLKIWNGGSAFCCVFNGPSQVHKNRDIIAALVWGKQHVS